MYYTYLNKQNKIFTTNNYMMDDNITLLAMDTNILTLSKKVKKILSKVRRNKVCQNI